MEGLTFTSAAPPIASDPARMDIACFVGFIARRPVPTRRPGEAEDAYLDRVLSPELRQWLAAREWRPGQRDRTLADFLALRDLPVPIDTWDRFDALFAWEQRPLDRTGRHCDTWMGAALRRFFAAGGRKAYVVRLGDPWTVGESASHRASASAALLPTLSPPTPADRTTWRGAGHLLGLPDVSFLCVPDLPDLFSVTPSAPLPAKAPPAPERFVECATHADPTIDRGLRGIPAPRCNAETYRAWATRTVDLGRFLSRASRETQLVAAVPLPLDAQAAAGRPAPESAIRDAHDAQWTEVRAICSRFIQLTYPWLRTRAAGRLPGNVEPPDAWVTGLLANNALTRATWRSAVRRAVTDVAAVEPVLDRGILNRPLAVSRALDAAPGALTLQDRLTVIGPTPGGFRLLSDVTTAAAGPPGEDESLDADGVYRPANVSRLLATLLRTARLLGEELVFQNNGEALWVTLHDRLESFLAGLWAEGALAGASAAEAFEVRCDRSTMTQADLDAGRVVVRVSFTAAMPIVHITVVFAMDEGGQVTLAGTEPMQSQAA